MDNSVERGASLCLSLSIMTLRELIFSVTFKLLATIYCINKIIFANFVCTIC